MPDYIHGTSRDEQARLSNLNRLTNFSFLNLLSLPARARVIDFGCGLGTLLGQVAESLDIEAWGIEKAEEQVARASELLSARPNVRLIHGNALSPDLPRDYFDVAYCRFFLEHVSEPVVALPPVPM